MAFGQLSRGATLTWDGATGLGVDWPVANLIRDGFPIGQNFGWTDLGLGEPLMCLD